MKRRHDRCDRFKVKPYLDVEKNTKKYFLENFIKKKPENKILYLNLGSSLEPEKCTAELT